MQVIVKQSSFIGRIGPALVQPVKRASVVGEKIVVLICHECAAINEALPLTS